MDPMGNHCLVRGGSYKSYKSSNVVGIVLGSKDYLHQRSSIYSPFYAGLSMVSLKTWYEYPQKARLHNSFYLYEHAIVK
jgi:hypothetical protein